MLGMLAYRQEPTTTQQLQNATQDRKILPNPTTLAARENKQHPAENNKSQLS
jgi:hypothetical protein